MGTYVSGLAFPDIGGRFVVPKLGIKRSGFRVECVPPTLDCSQFFGFPSFNRRPL